MSKKGRYSVQKAEYRKEVYDNYQKRANNIAYEGGFELTDTGDAVLKDGEVIGQGKQRWFKAWHMLEHGYEGQVIY